MKSLLVALSLMVLIAVVRAGFHGFGGGHGGGHHIIKKPIYKVGYKPIHHTSFKKVVHTSFKPVHHVSHVPVHHVSYKPVLTHAGFKAISVGHGHGGGHGGGHGWW